MKTRGGGGKIVNISSASGFRALGAPPVYTTTKAAVCQLTRSAAGELAQYDINVNAIAPGVTDTPMMAGYPRELAVEGTLSNLFKRWASAEDVANSVIFLCSPESRQITGQVIHTSAGGIV
jgi:NAD(P)-dependent dehydrogenase (short-subunit alcohol dehydrogenase family)